jgi:hypothetical protein
MTDLDAAALVAEDRPDFTMLSCVPVALPYWRLRVRVEVLAQRRISPLEEFVMRASREADPALAEIRAVLGLDERTFTGTVDALVGHEWAVVTPGDRLGLTTLGTEVADTAVRERSEARVISFDYDGLLRGPMLLDLPIEPQQRRSLGLRELTASPATAPDVLELQDSLGELEQIIRRSGGARDQEIELLAIKGILRRERIYREAMLVVLRSADGKVQAAPIVEGVLSQDHESALSHPEVIGQLRLASELRRGRRHDGLLPSQLRARYDREADDEARSLRLRARRERSGAGSELSKAAQLATGALPVRTVLPYEHPRLVDTIFRSATDRVHLATPNIAPLAVDRDTIANLEEALRRGVNVSIRYGHESKLPEPEPLLRLAERNKALDVRSHTGLTVSTLIRDDNLAVRTLFPLLAHYGWERPFRDERGWLIQRPENVAFIVDEVADVFE